MKTLRQYLIGYLLIMVALSANAQRKLVVDQKGRGDFKSIQGALNSLSDSSATPRVIYIRDGVYREKLYIEKSNIVLEGSYPITDRFAMISRNIIWIRIVLFVIRIHNNVNGCLF